MNTLRKYYSLLAIHNGYPVGWFLSIMVPVGLAIILFLVGEGNDSHFLFGRKGEIYLMPWIVTLGWASKTEQKTTSTRLASQINLVYFLPLRKWLALYGYSFWLLVLFLLTWLGFLFFYPGQEVVLKAKPSEMTDIIRQQWDLYTQHYPGSFRSDLPHTKMLVVAGAQMEMRWWNFCLVLSCVSLLNLYGLASHLRPFLRSIANILLVVGLFFLIFLGMGDTSWQGTLFLKFKKYLPLLFLMHVSIWMFSAWLSLHWVKGKAK